MVQRSAKSCLAAKKRIGGGGRLRTDWTQRGVLETVGLKADARDMIQIRHERLQTANRGSLRLAHSYRQNRASPMTSEQRNIPGAHNGPMEACLRFAVLRLTQERTKTC